MKHILTILAFIAISLQAQAQTGFFRPAYIGHLPDTHNIQVLVGDTTLKYGAWIDVDSLATLVISGGGVTGRIDNYIQTGASGGGLDQNIGLQYDEVTDVMRLDSALTINGVSGLTPTTVKVLKDGILEWDFTNNSTDTAHLHIKVHPIQKDQGNVPWIESLGSTTFEGTRRDQSHYQGFNLLPGGVRLDDTQTATGLVFENFYEPAPGGQIYDEFQFRQIDSNGIERRLLDWRVNRGSDTASLADYGANLMASEFRFTDPLNSNSFVRFRRDGTNGAHLDLYGSFPSLTKGIAISVDPANNLAQITPAGMTNPIIYTSGFWGTSVSRLHVGTMEGTPATFLTRDANGFVNQMTKQAAADTIAQYITFEGPPGGGIDSIVTCWNGDIGFVVMGDTTCVDQDSFYVIEPCTYFIIMNDTVEICIPEGTPGQNIGNSNLSMTNTPGGLRTFNLDTASLHLRRGTSDRLVIHNDQSTSIVSIRGGSGTVKPQLAVNSINQETGGAGIHLRGLTDATHVRDYSIWMNPSGSGSFVFSEQSTPGDPFFIYYGFLDSITIPKMIQFNHKVLDEDGDTGTTGQVLVAQADGTVNWSAAGGADTNFFTDDLSQTGTRSHQANNYTTEITEVDTFQLIGNGGTSSMIFDDSTAFTATINNGTNTSNLVATATQAYLYSIGATEEAAVYARADGDIEISSSTGNYVLGNLVGSEPPSGAITDSVVMYDYANRKLRVMHIDLLPSGAGGPIPINDLLAADGTNTIDNAALAQEWQWNSLASGTGLKLSSNSTAAASNTHKLLGLSLTGVNATSTQTTYGLHVEHAKTGTLGTNIAGYFESLTGIVSYGVFGNVDDGFAVYGNATSGVGAYGSATSGTGILGSVTTGLAGYLISNPATTNSVINSFDIHRNSSGGAGANGIGSQFRFLHETSTTVSTEASTIASLWTDATHATRTSALDFYTVNSATLARKMRIAGSGQLTLDTYGAGTHTGTITKSLAVTSAGEVVEENGYRVLAVGHPAESKTNDVTTEQDYSSIYTIPANYLTENKVIRVTLGFQYTTGTSSATVSEYVELGGTKTLTWQAINIGDGITRQHTLTFLIHGTAAAGASVNVESVYMSGHIAGVVGNSTTQPVALATNGTLSIVPGLQYSATGSTETMELRTFLVEQLN